MSGIVESPDIRFRIDFKGARGIKLNWHFINFVSIVSSLLVTLRHSLRHSLHYCPRLYYCNCRGCSQHFQPTVPSATARERKAAAARAGSEPTVSSFEGDAATARIRICLSTLHHRVLYWKAWSDYRETNHLIHKSVWRELATMPTLKPIQMHPTRRIALKMHSAITSA